MGAGRGGAEGEKRNETVGRGVVCVCVITQRACVHVCRTPTARPAAQPPAQSERGRERKFTAKEQQQQQRAPERGRAASRRARRSGDQAQTRPAETAATTPTTPGASRPITSSTKNGTGLSSRPSFTGVETEPSTHRWGGQIDRSMQNPTPDRKWDVVKERKVPSELRIAHGVNTHQTFHCIAHLHACTAAHAAVDRER